MYFHSPAVLLRFENQQLKLSTSLEFKKNIKNLSEKKQLFASTYSNIFYKIIKKFILKLFSMFVFYMFSQNPVDENNLYYIKTVNKSITFPLKKSYIFLTLCIDVSPNTVA